MTYTFDKQVDYLTTRDRAAVEWAIENGVAALRDGAELCCKTARIFYRFTAARPGARGAVCCERREKRYGKLKSYWFYFTPAAVGA